RSQRHQANIFVEQLGGDLRDQVEALLRGEARNNADKGPARIRRQSEFGEQRQFALLLARKIVCGVIVRDQRIVFGVPLVVIHAVDDSINRPVFAKESVQAESILRRLDLSRVTLADGAYRVAPGNSSLEQIELAVKLQLL